MKQLAEHQPGHPGQEAEVGHPRADDRGEFAVTEEAKIPSPEWQGFSFAVGALATAR